MAINVFHFAILRELGEKSGVTLHIYIRPVSTDEENKIIKVSEHRNRHKQSTAKDIKASVSADENMKDIKKLVTNQYHTKEVLVHCVVFFELIAPSYADLLKLQNETTSSCSHAKLICDKLWLRQKDGFLTVMPTGSNQFKRVMFFLDEFGTLPKFDNAEQMFTAGRSRNIIFFPMIQSMAQLDKNYGREGAKIIVDSCQNALFGGLAPLSGSGEDLSRMMGTQTVQSGSVSHSSNGLSNNSASRSYQMTQKPLMSADQLKTMPKNQWVLMKTRSYPLLTTLKRFNEWGIQLDSPFQLNANKDKLRAAILSKYPQKKTIALQNVTQDIQSDEPPAGLKRTQISDEFI